MKRTKVILAYIPVLHRGYLEFFKKNSAKILYLIGDELITKFDFLVRDFRRLSPSFIKQALDAQQIFNEIYIVDRKMIQKLRSGNVSIIMPDEDISREIAKKYLKNRKVSFDSTWLRWDKTKTLSETLVVADRKVSNRGLIRTMMKKAEEESQKSSDWWRQVGAIIARNGRILLTSYNRHVPTPQNPYILGDPRSNFQAGENIELSTAHHAEARLIAEAARKGIRLEGTDLYVTTFPCPVCAKQIAGAGIKRLFFMSGYSRLDAAPLLREAGIEIIKVD